MYIYIYQYISKYMSIPASFITSNSHTNTDY